MKVKITTNTNMEYYGCAKNTIIDVDLEDYVTCVVASEVGNAPLEACKAQAVAARSFAIARGVLSGKVISDSSATAQAYRANRIGYATCAKAAWETKGQVLTYNGNVISANYCEANGGRTYSSEEVWGTKKPYLIAQSDPWDSSAKSGHGVGMSQKGAIAAARAGKTYKEILGFYYPGTKISLSRPAILHVIRGLIQKIRARL